MGLGRPAKLALGRLFPRLVLVKGAAGSRPRIALTFDDGPHPEHTPAILDALAAGHAKATFFLQGTLAQRHPALVRAISDGGHQVANHGWSHSRASEVGGGAFVREVIDTQALLEETVGRALPRMYRPPYGTISLLPFVRLAGRGYRAVFWSLDSRDSFERESAAVASAIGGAVVRSGDIVLLHEDYRHTVEALPTILKTLTTRGFWLPTLVEL